MNANTTANTTVPGDDRAAANPESATATPATIPADGAQTVTPAPVPTPADCAKNRDHADDVQPAPFRRTTRQFDFGNGRRLVDMRATNGGLDVIPEAPGVCFDNLPHMTEREAILAALDCPGMTDAARVALVREIVTAGHADGGDAIR